MNDSLQCSQQQYPICWQAVSSSNVQTIVPPSASNANPLPNNPNLVIGASIAVVLPFLFVLPIMGYRKYRTVVLRRQIETLERLWKVDSRR